MGKVLILYCISSQCSSTKLKTFRNWFSFSISAKGNHRGSRPIQIQISNKRIDVRPTLLTHTINIELTLHLNSKVKVHFYDILP